MSAIPTATVPSKPTANSDVTKVTLYTGIVDASCLKDHPEFRLVPAKDGKPEHWHVRIQGPDRRSVDVHLLDGLISGELEGHVRLEIKLRHVAKEGAPRASYVYVNCRPSLDLAPTHSFGLGIGGAGACNYQGSHGWCVHLTPL